MERYESSNEPVDSRCNNQYPLSLERFPDETIAARLAKFILRKLYLNFQRGNDIEC